MAIPQENNKNNIDKLAANGINSKKEFDLFFKKYYTLFLSFACRYHLDTEEARDIVQEVFIAFWEQRGNFPSIVTIKAFFYRFYRQPLPQLPET